MLKNPGGLNRGSSRRPTLGASKSFEGAFPAAPMLLVAAPCLGISSPNGPGCVSAYCSFRRDGFAGLAPFDFAAPTLQWEAAGGYAFSCAGDGELAVCSGPSGVTGFNASGRIWHAGFSDPALAPQAPFLTTSNTWGDISGALESCGPAAPAGCRTATLRGKGDGSIAFSADLSADAVRGESLGPWVLPRVQYEQKGLAATAPVGDDGLLLISRGDGLVMAWNVELGLCWATLFFCLHPAVDNCNSEGPGRLRPLGPPALLEAGGVAYFSAVSRAAASQVSL